MLMLAAIASLAVVGCGGSSSSASSPSSDTGSSGNELPAGHPSKQFLGPKGEENIQAKYGREGTVDELAQTGKLVEESIEARSRHDWAGQCATLSKKTVESVVGKGKKASECAKAVEALAKEAPPSVLRDNIEGSVLAVRVADNNSGYALYHGNDEKDWAMPIEKEGDEWRVASLAALELKR